ncbi:hypothetical protein GCM10027454_19840 [Algoriphagus aestuariicola]
MSKGSCGAVRSQNYSASDCGFISEPEFGGCSSKDRKAQEEDTQLDSNSQKIAARKDIDEQRP